MYDDDNEESDTPIKQLVKETENNLKEKTKELEEKNKITLEKIIETNKEVGENSNNDISVEDQPDNNNIANMANNEVCRVSIKPPTFLKNDPALYFMQMEAQFTIAGISQDTTKFNHIIASFDPIYLQAVSDIVRNPPILDKYDTIKNRLINEFTASDQKKLRQAIHEVELGDDKPSQLLKKIKDLAGNSLNDDAIKSLWIERLPYNVRAVISIVEGDSFLWAKQADKMMEITNFKNDIGSNINEIKIEKNEKPSTINEISEIKKAIDEIHNKMNERFDRNRSRSRQRYNNNGRFRSSSRNNAKQYENCWYHFKYKGKAKNCRSPCNWDKNNKKEN